MKQPLSLLPAAFAALALAALPTGAMADTANTVTVTKFHQSYPYSGKATVEYTVGGTLPAGAFAEITISTDDASATFVQSNIVAGANSYVIDFASSFGGALVLTNASFVVRINPGDNDIGGIQLWENGPYWAECNVGASEPEESGYYFWWGDTVGYTRSGGTWDERNSRFYDVTWVSSTGEQMSNSPFPDSPGPITCPTMDKDNSTLQSEGWIDATTNLVAAHDAATAHLGSPWRMPTAAEVDALVDNCTTTWTTRNGVSGRLVTGKGAYANRSIFLPASGDVSGIVGRYGNYWSSTPHSDWEKDAWGLYFISSGFQASNDFYQNETYRYEGWPVRPVRDAGSSADGSVTYDPEPPVYVMSFHQSSPYSGRATVEYTVNMTLFANVVAEFTISTDDASATFVQSNIVTGANSHVIDFASSFGGALVLTNASFTVTIKPGGGVQLWENGPNWAACNVGASEPEEYGYYFWWGDTVGYTRSGGTWNDLGGGEGYYSSVTWVSSTGQQMSSSPFVDSSCPTFGINDAALQSAGYIDSTGNLVAANDAATAHLGAPWRMPTDAEFAALIENCTTTWITTNGVSGYLVTGKGAYADRSIFLPAAGGGIDSRLYYPGSNGFYWSSTPLSDYSYYACDLRFYSGNFRRGGSYRYCGQSVRPVRGFAE